MLARLFWDGSVVLASVWMRAGLTYYNASPLLTLLLLSSLSSFALDMPTSRLLPCHQANGKAPRASEPNG